MADVPFRVAELVETFDQNIEVYRSQQYNETQVRREFIDPFFDELGWDVSNKAGYAQAYKDVIHEDAIKIDTTEKQIDQLVYELYGLTEEEIKIIEENT